MIKMGGMICDMCRVLIRTSPGDRLLMRKTKKGTMMHFCSDECMKKDTPKKPKPSKNDDLPSA